MSREPFDEFGGLDRVAQAFADKLDAMTKKDWEDYFTGQGLHLCQWPTTGQEWRDVSAEDQGDDPYDNVRWSLNWRWAPCPPDLTVRVHREDDDVSDG